ncbi:MAG: hypothetical protein QOH81_1123, partial [Sphingomonadales bacterium]|nr:hypothetical protein [Sphingomonadales bacterium]
MTCTSRTRGSIMMISKLALAAAIAGSASGVALAQEPL